MIALAFLVCSFLLINNRTPRPQKLRAGVNHSKVAHKKLRKVPARKLATEVVAPKVQADVLETPPAPVKPEAVATLPPVKLAPSVAATIAAVGRGETSKEVSAKQRRPVTRVATAKKITTNKVKVAAVVKEATADDVLNALVRLAPASVVSEVAAANTETDPQLEQITEKSFEESALLGDYDADEATSAVQREAKSLDERFPKEARLYQVEGLLQKDDFKQIRSRLDLIKSHGVEPIANFTSPKPAPQPELVIASKAPTKNEEKNVATLVDADLERIEAEETSDILTASAAIPARRVAQAEPALARDLEASEGTVSDATPAASTEPELVSPGLSTPNEAVAEETPDTSPVAETATETSPSRSIAAPTLAMPSIASSVVSQLAAPPTPPAPSIQAPTQSVTTHAANETPSRKSDSVESPQKVRMLLARTVATEGENPSDTSTEEFLQDSLEGSLKIDFAVLKDLFDRFGENWHIELHLEPERTDRQEIDTQPVPNYRYTPQVPNEHFRLETSKLPGPVNLYARIFTPTQMGPVATIPFGEKITRDYADHIRFDVNWAKYQKAFRVPLNSNAPLTITVTVFEGGSADHQEPLPIPGAMAQVLVPDLGTFTDDGQGNIKIPNVAPDSDLKVKIWADGYYETQHTIVRTSPTDSYSVVYLVGKENVRKITTHITKTELDPEAGILMGRIYKDRKPAKDATLSLSFRKGRALFMEALKNPWLRDILPNVMLPATTRTGLYAFYNIAKSMRSLMHSFGQYPALVNVKPGSAYYVEFGRNPSAIRMQVRDIISQSYPEMNIKVVGESSPEVTTDEKGIAVFKNVDLPRGTTTVEVSGKEYDPPTWHTIPVGTKQRRKTWELFVFRDKYSELKIDSFSKLPTKPGNGAVIGGIEPGAFAGKKGCVTARLKSLNGVEITEVTGHGPFPWGENSSGTCLTKENPRFQFPDLEHGEYAIELLDSTGTVFRSRIFFVGKGRRSIVII